MDDLTGQIFGGYELINRLPQGGEADVYMGTGNHQEKVVIRILQKKNDVNTVGVERHHQREEGIYQQLAGAPYIIRLLSYGEENGRYYLVMPYIAKGSLKDAMNDLSSKECLTYIKQATEALNCVHQIGHMHRDVKPENLLLGDYGILLSDFGLAHEATTTPPKTRENWGSEFYRAPEQGNGQPCQKSDQYSLARTMCVLLTRIKPKWDKDGKVINGQEIEDNLDKKFPEIFKVYRIAIDEKPENRYKTIIEFKEALEQAGRTDLGMDTTIPIRELGGTSGGGSIPTQHKHMGKGGFSWKKVFLPLLLIVMFIIASVGWVGATAENQRLHLVIDDLRLNTLTVTTLKDNDSGSLRQIIDAAKNKQAATIRFDPSLPQGTIELTKDLEIPTNVNIVAPTDRKITIIPQNPEIKIHVPQGSVVSLANIYFKGDSQERSSAFIVNEGTLHMKNCRVSGFKSTHSSGALENRNGTLTFTKSEIDSNESKGNGGGAISNVNGTITLDDSKVHDNRTYCNGGGIYSLNGHVFIKNGSSIYENEVKEELSGGDIGGGGGMLIRGGSLSITDSSIKSNIAIGDGGGILLTGASAYIDNSPVQFNKTHTGKTGGIAVIYNPENGHHSILTLKNNTLVKENTSSKPSSSNDTTVDIQGKVVDQDHDQNPMNKYIISESGSLPPYVTFPQFLGYLTLTDFQDYCKDLQNGQKLLSVELSSGAQKITCKFDGREEELSTQNYKVNQVCAKFYRTAKNHLARLFRYTDITTWQCFKDERELLPNIEQPLLDMYCQDKMKGSGAVTVNKGKTAHDWRCKRDSKNLSINMDLACQYVKDNPLAIAVLKDYNDPHSWQCWGPR